MHKCIRKIISLMTIITVSFSSIGTAAAAGSIDPNSQSIVEEEIETNGELVAQTESVCPSYQEVYNSMNSLKETYPEGTRWTNFEPYGSKGPLGDSYKWKGGSVKGATSGVGCAAFVFILSDTAFGSLPARTIDNGNFKFEDVKVGDILRVNNSHFVIVMQKSAVGVTLAEGNYNKSVHWGRAMSKEEVMAANFLVTRYPTNFNPSDDPEADNEVVQSGTAGSLSWTLTRAGTLTISGEGSIPDYSKNDNNFPSWNVHSDAINSIVIEDGVTGIGDYAFYQSKALSVYIPDGVTSIGQSAFYESKLIAATIPGTVLAIGDDAFRNCANLTSVTVSEGVKTIGERAFKGCTSLSYIDFPASIVSVGAAAFMDCSKMSRVRFMPGDETVEMGANLFTDCWELADVTLPKTADCISTEMFYSCRTLQSIYIPEGVSKIGERAFTQCFGLEKGGISFGGSEATWNTIGGDSAILMLKPYTVEVRYNVKYDDPFATDPNDPGDLIIPEPSEHEHVWSEDWSSDAAGHWRECSAEDCPVTDNSQKGGYAEHSYGDWVVDTEAAVGQAGSKHRDCTICEYRETESISMLPGDSSGSPSPSGSPVPSGSPSPSGSPVPSESPTPVPGPSGSPTQIPDPSESPSPTLVPSGSPTPAPSESPAPSPSGSPSPTSVPSGSPTPVPSGSPVPSPSESPSPLPTSSPSLGEGKTFTSSKVTYQVTKSGKEVELKKIRSTSSKMTVNTVTGTDGVEYKVTSIAPNAMKDNKKLKNLTIGDNVKHIKANAFAGCTNLKTVNIGKNVTTIRSGAFKGCTSLKRTVNIGGTSRSDLTRIRKNAFNGCEKLSKVTIKSTKLRSVEEKAFKGTRSDLKVKVPSKQLTKYRKMLKNAGLKAKQVTK